MARCDAWQLARLSATHSVHHHSCAATKARRSPGCAVARDDPFALPGGVARPCAQACRSSFGTGVADSAHWSYSARGVRHRKWTVAREGLAVDRGRSAPYSSEVAAPSGGIHQTWWRGQYPHSESSSAIEKIATYGRTASVAAEAVAKVEDCCSSCNAVVSNARGLGEGVVRVAARRVAHRNRAIFQAIEYSLASSNRVSGVQGDAYTSGRSVKLRCRA